MAIEYICDLLVSRSARLNVLVVYGTRLEVTKPAEAQASASAPA